ncbi:MAG: hypothetical protein ABL890_02580 [Candidatus Peribacteraceae bacterium]
MKDRFRTLTDTLIVTYLLITGWAFFVTMTHIFPIGPLRPIVIFSYGMMAPYQGSSAVNTELVVRATTPEGTTVLASIDHYFPGLHGERNSRQLLEQFADRSPEKLEPYFDRFLEQFLALEAGQGRLYSSATLFSEVWLRDPAGYDRGREKGVKRTFLSQYP